MRTLFSAYEKLMDIIYSVIRICIAAALVVMVVVTFVEVIRRYAFGLSFIWSEELVRFLLVATSFLGGARGLSGQGSGSVGSCDQPPEPRYSEDHRHDRDDYDHRRVRVSLGARLRLLLLPTDCQHAQYRFGPAMTYVYLTIPIGFTLIILFARAFGPDAVFAA